MLSVKVSGLRTGQCVGSVAAVMLLAVTSVAAMAEQRSLPAAAAVEVDYAQHIEPIFAENCYGCHGAERQRGNFRLDRADHLLLGGISGEPALQPGNGGESHLVRLVAGLEPELKMPPEGDPLSDEQIALLRAWIDQGAANTLPESEGGADDQMWSFQPVADVAVPSAGEAWSANPIDRFIYHRLSDAGLEPSEPEDRAVLTRRLYMVMHGLLPTPEQVTQFVDDDRPDAYERLVDEVLASPRYGERWAQHWLDVVRFGETHGFEVNTPRENAWPYRDYVINALNEDLPYDQFVREQIVGDALGADAATGMLVAAPVILPGQVGKDEASMRLAREDELAQVINTVSGTFLGLTLGCARCHNHMFDPITQRDYFAMQAVFQGVNYSERKVGPNKATRERAAGLAEQIKPLDRQLATIRQRADYRAATALLREPVDAAGNEEHFEPVEAALVRFTITRTNDGLQPCIDELEIWTPAGDGAEPRNVGLASNGGVPTASGSWANDRHKLAHINNGRVGNSHSWVSDTAGSGWVQIELAEPTSIDRITWARDRKGEFDDRLAVEYRIEVAAEPGGEWRTVAGSDDRSSSGRSLGEWAADHLPEAVASRYLALTAEREALAQEREYLLSERSIWAGAFTAQPEPTRRKYRGDPMSPREVVPPAGPAVFDAFELPTETPDQARRMALAEWLADPKHPLTARVMVNRIWQHHFGTGLVTTPSDFGGLGAEPSHPQLLDWLAGEFVRSGWSIKHMHRLILTSRTFQQSSRPDSASLAVDGDARLLWRFPPRRGEAEIVRDAILMVSGTLDLRMGGPSFDAFKPNDNYVRVYEPLEEFKPEHFRRMIYMQKVRMEPEGVFGAFDLPDLATPCPSRSQSTTPLQALNLFNSTFVVDQADRLSDRLREEVGDQPEPQVRRAFELALGREPDAVELAQSVKVIEQHDLNTFTRTLMNLSEFLYIQ